jgi:hypothetical protein
MNNETLHSKLRDHSLIKRLMKNPNWKPAADAAIAELVDGKKCPVPSWKKSSTWMQVELALKETMSENSSTKEVER